ncbi:MAG: NAD(P)/FAD-dependent oxidoreductase, partial [Deltaproteobacteria bacterium]|nr:NAD(P)/FAD-dependent oxidoreductase [Deltaproteobacteria bacterium]
RSDSDKYTFGYSFKPWVEDADIATGDAILRYLNETVDEYGVRDRIRFGHRVTRVAWSSEDKRWVADVCRTADGSTFQMSTDFLLTCTGYYNYEHGYLPKFDGFDDYQGVVAHPQHWPEDLDYADKRVLVIGSGATAVTVVPAMAKAAEHVTMLQRSPTYIFSRPAEDQIAKTLRRFLPNGVAHDLTRVKNVGLQWLLYTLARKRPEWFRKTLRNNASEMLGPDVDVDVHFNPSYEPWDQRLCLIPDGDLYLALRDGDASIVTDTIDRFTESGVVLSSGKTIDVDVVVPATGLELQFLGGMTMEVDGEQIDGKELVSYKGMMFSNVPNWAHFLGYTAASWTLKVDLTADYICRLLDYMQAHGYQVATPILDGSMATEPIMTKLSKAGYVKRSEDRLPKQGVERPWRNPDNYMRDYAAIKWGRMDDGVLRFEGSAAAKRKRFELSGKTAVVTGAASGIGAALADELAGRGCDLVLVDVNREGLLAAAASARSRGVQVSTSVVDMGDAKAVEAFAAELGTVDVLINNAGVALGGHFQDVSKDDFEWLMGINFYGVVNLTRALLPRLSRRPDAHIANVSSVFGMIAPPGQAAYCASKFAVRGFSESLRHELAGSSVGVSVVHPGGIKTNIARNARLPLGIDKDALGDELETYEKNFINTPEKAARIIADGIERRRPRIMIGPDAKAIEWLERLLPVRNVRVFEWILGKLGAKTLTSYRELAERAGITVAPPSGSAVRKAAGS